MVLLATHCFCSLFFPKFKKLPFSMLPLYRVNNNDHITMHITEWPYIWFVTSDEILSICVCSRNQERISFTTYHRLVYFSCSDIIVDLRIVLTIRNDEFAYLKLKFTPRPPTHTDSHGTWGWDSNRALHSPPSLSSYPSDHSFCGWCKQTKNVIYIHTCWNSHAN